MVDLSTLDELSPRDSDPVSSGDDAIRQTREAIKTTVGVEHDLSTGFHRIPVGSTAMRPPPGNAGRLFANTDTGQLSHDTGVEWRSVTGIGSFQLDSWGVAITGTPVLLYELNFGVPRTILLFGDFGVGTTGSTLDVLTYIEIDSDLAPVVFACTTYASGLLALCRTIGAITIWGYTSRPLTETEGITLNLSTQMLVI